MRFLLLLLPLLAGLAAPPRAHAQEAGIHRCVDAQGRQVFTDRRCADMQATPVLPDADSPAPASAPMGDAAPRLCASSLDALKQQVVDAFDTHDPNRMAGLMLWDGYSKHAVVADIQALSALMQHTLLDIDDGSTPGPATQPPDIYDASRPLEQLLSEPTADSASSPTTLTLVTAADDATGGSQRTPFALVHQSGCLWLRPSN